MQEHRVLVACEALWADRALRRALLRQPTEAREDEPAPLEEIRHQGERENPTQTEPPRLGEAGEHELPADPAARSLWTTGERTHRGEFGGQDGSRSTSAESGHTLSYGVAPEMPGDEM